MVLTDACAVDYMFAAIYVYNSVLNISLIIIIIHIYAHMHFYLYVSGISSLLYPAMVGELPG